MYHFFKSDFFFKVSAFFVLVGLVFFVYFTFIDKTNNQDVVLAAIKSNQESVNNLKTQLDDQQKTIQGLTKVVCELQKQVKSLGAEPVVEATEECIKSEL